MSLWPHPTLEEAFADLLKQDEQITARIRAAEQALSELKANHAHFSQSAADTVRLSIMQRNNAEAAALRLAPPPSHQEKP